MFGCSGFGGTFARMRARGWLGLLALCACSASHLPSDPEPSTTETSTASAGRGGTAVSADGDAAGGGDRPRDGDAQRDPVMGDQPSANEPQRDPDARDPQPDSADGDVPAAGDPEVGDDPAADPNGRDPGAAPSGPLAEALFGHWWAFGNIGDCINVQSWYSFADDGGVIARSIDDNACGGVRVLSETPGRFALDGRELEITLEGLGPERPFDMAQTTLEVAQRIERATIAIAERPATASRAAETYLDSKAFSSSDGQQFLSQRSMVLSSAAGELLFVQDALLTLGLSRALPLPEGDGVRVKLSASLTQLDAAANTGKQHDEIALEYDAIVVAEQGWLRIMPTRFAGESNEQTIEEWQAMLADQGVESHPDWSRRLLQAHFFPSQRFTAGNVTLLASTLPEYGRWTRSDAPPPMPSP